MTSHRTAAAYGAVVLMALAFAAPTPPTSPEAATTQVAAGRYLVTLAEKPIATYAGGVAGIGRTKPDRGRKLDVGSADAERYRAHLTARQREVASAVGVTPVRHFAVATNTFVADLTGAQALTLMRSRGVVSVVPNRLLKPADDRNSADFLKLSGPKGVWSALGGTDEAGKGVVVGVIDTGVWPESASFAAPALTATPPGDDDPYRPYARAGEVVMRKADGGTFTGTCQAGEQFTAALCNEKIISARYFSDGWTHAVPPEQRADYLSPRDAQGHGTHTASTAAGNAGVEADVAGVGFGEISGVAPGAAIAVYKALYQGRTSDDTGGTEQDIVAAIDQAVADGVDVLNYSVGTVAESAVTDPVQLAFLNAAAAGVFVSAAGGNSGPDASSLDNTAPWETTVAASTIGQYTATVALGDGRSLTGVSTTVAAEVKDRPLVLAAAVKNAAAADGAAAACLPDSLDPAKAAGTIVVCQRDAGPRAGKSAEVARAGGAGMVLVNTYDYTTDPDLHAVPTVHLNVPAATTVRTYAATEGARASLVPGGDDMPYPQVAVFSSRGPSEINDGDLLKPDIAAPGVSILAAVAPPAYAGHDFDFLSGTSMATPHVAGLAALYFGEHPTMSPMAVKSALMTTAGPISTATGEVSTDVFAYGAGEADPSKMLAPGLVYDSGEDDWLGYLEGRGVDTGTGVPAIAPNALNYPSIAVGDLMGTVSVRREVTALTPGVYHAEIDLPGIEAKVKPPTLKFDEAGQTKEFTVTFALGKGTPGQAHSGSLTWTGAGAAVRSPIVVTPQVVVAPETLTGSGATGSITFQITPGVPKLPIDVYGLEHAEPVAGSVAPGGEQDVTFTVQPDTKLLQTVVRTDAPAGSLLPLLVRLPEDATSIFDGGVIVASADDPADPAITVVEPEPGRYALAVFSFGAADVSFTTQVNTVPVKGGGGSLTLSPRHPEVTPGTPMDLTLSWSGLTGTGRHTGYLEYPDGTGTVVSVG
ncbi:serine protease [Nonomuraea terrae]|uniref:Serine protease n=1 Tax=Nonomuraea terrae TaxID=2530383 RepID=A0A4R4Z038_9ACTN|nr:S8 family serine peptidase [Nonomuraea terrae]TDD51195.1 serine protease [Nonomuraea terrae]